MTGKLRPGYHVFYSTNFDEKGYDRGIVNVQHQINEAEKEFEITFLSGPSYKDDPSSRGVSFVSQACVLKAKE